MDAFAAAASLAAAAVGIAVAAAGFTLLVRRMAGGFTTVPAIVLPWTVAAGGIPLVIAVEFVARLGGDRWPAWLARGGLIAAALSVAPVVGSAAWPMRAAGLVGTVVAAFAAVWPGAGWRPPRLRGLRLAGEPPARPAADGPDRRREGAHHFPAGPPQSASADWQAQDGDRSETFAGHVRQRLERYETPAGEDCVRGQVMLSVAAGSRTGHAHVGFCPPFATLPAVEVTTDCDFVEAEVAAAEVLPWGVRVECRLSEPAEEPLEIPVAIRAVRPAS